MRSHRLRRRYGLARRTLNLNIYRDLPADPAAGSPLEAYGVAQKHLVGPYWTVPVTVPLEELAGLKAVEQDKRRVQSVRAAIEQGTVLPPIEIGVFRRGGGWLVDGNHRLAEARASKRPSIEARFTFVE